MITMMDYLPQAEVTTEQIKPGQKVKVNNSKEIGIIFGIIGNSKNQKVFNIVIKDQGNNTIDKITCYHSEFTLI